jgi:fluoride exporter
MPLSAHVPFYILVSAWDRFTSTHRTHSSEIRRKVGEYVPYVAVALGGFIGAVLRYVISEWWGTQHGFPLATLVINLAGSFFLMWFYTLTLDRFPIHPHVRLGIGTGLVGAFTTFSTFCVETWKLIESAEYVTAGLYVASSLFGGILLSAIGYFLARRQTELRMVKKPRTR